MAGIGTVRRTQNREALHRWFNGAVRTPWATSPRARGRGLARTVSPMLAVVLALGALGSSTPAHAYTIGMDERPVLTGSTVGDGRATLTWTDAETAVAYWIYRNHEVIAVIGDDEPLAFTFTDDTAPNGDALVYQVAAHRLDGSVDLGDGAEVALPAPPNPFSDVPAHLDPPVDWLSYGDGEVPFDPGYPDGTFRHRQVVTRGELVAMLYGMAGRPDPRQFPRIDVRDVPASLKAAVRWAVADPDGNGPGQPIASIRADHTFRPGTALDRGTGAVMTWRFAGMPTGFPNAGFSDVPFTRNAAVNFLVGIGAMTGYPDHTFHTTRGLKRGDTARLLHTYAVAFTRVLFAYLPEAAPGTDWTPPDVLPAGENAWYLRDLDRTDGAPSRHLLTRANSVMHRPEVRGGTVHVWAQGGGAILDLVLPPGATRLEKGLYSESADVPWSGPTPDHLGGEVQVACPAGRSWFAVDDVAYADDGGIDRLYVRYGYQCPDAPPERTAVGAIHYDRTAATAPPPPRPIPDDLWAPPAGSVPTDGENYFYVSSAPGDWIGRGHTHLFLQDDAHLDPTPDGNGVSLGPGGWDSLDPSIYEGWGIEAQPPAAYPRLEEGFYPDIGRIPALNPARSSLAVTSDAHGCDAISWLAVDDVAYQPDGSFARLDLRFEHRCTTTGLGAPLLGAYHYDVAFDRPSINPQLPIPFTYWRPTAPLPASGNYLYLDSQAGDFVLDGQDQLLAAADAAFRTDWPGTTLAVQGADRAHEWYLSIAPPLDAARLARGYYERTRAGQNVHGSFCIANSGSCTMGPTTGDFVVDDVAYAPDGSLQRLYLRFRQSNYGSPYLRGQLHWDAPAP